VVNINYTYPLDHLAAPARIRPALICLRFQRRPELKNRLFRNREGRANQMVTIIGDGGMARFRLQKRCWDRLDPTPDFYALRRGKRLC
jgi:hypothetical protein